MACLNDVLVSVTLNKLVVGCGDLLAGFSHGNFTACSEISSLRIVGHVLMIFKTQEITKPQAELGLQQHVNCSHCVYHFQI